MYLLVQEIKNYFNDMINLLDEIKQLEKRIEQLEEIINKNSSSDE